MNSATDGTASSSGAPPQGCASDPLGDLIASVSGKPAVLLTGTSKSTAPKVDVSKKDLDYAMKLCRQLREKKVHLLKYAVAMFGQNLCEELLKETLYVEAKGGMKAKDDGNKAGKRREPGGVFLTLLKGRVPADKFKAMYKASQPEDKLFRKRQQAMHDRSNQQDARALALGPAPGRSSVFERLEGRGGAAEGMDADGGPGAPCGGALEGPEPAEGGAGAVAPYEHRQLQRAHHNRTGHSRHGGRPDREDRMREVRQAVQHIRDSDVERPDEAMHGRVLLDYGDL